MVYVRKGPRTCSKCRTTDPEEGWASSGYCRPCNREYGKENYRQNKDRYFAQAKLRDKQLDALINAYKDRPCMDCGIQYPFYVMDLDHRDPAEKSHNISYMRRHKMAFTKIVAEMEKCDVVCSNCHRERTNVRNPARYTK